MPDAVIPPATSAASPARPCIRVACGVLQDAQGRVLLAQRPEGKIAAGYWEFPGGKIEPGESPRQALDRELQEELGIEVRAARPLIRFRHDYSNRSVLLDTWLVTAFDGEPQGREQQGLRWLSSDDLALQAPCLPTVAPIARALRLPLDYVFTPPAPSPAALLAQLPALPPGALLRLRCPALDDDRYAALAVDLIGPARAAGLKLILDRAPASVTALGAAGWHATAAMLMQLQARPLPESVWCLASCHTEAELRRAAALGFDAAVLGPVLATATHPGAAGIGWPAFAAWSADAALPVYALGGVGPRQQGEAFAAYAQGTAGISAYWRC